MACKLLPDFQKADSHNIPQITFDMYDGYLKTDEDYQSPEIREVKATKSLSELYGNVIIGYVQLKRSIDGHLCTVFAAVTPEQSVRNKPYKVEVNIDIFNGKITEAKCHDCIASDGGCKHHLAALAWLYRESNTPSVTEVKAYWKRSKLAGCIQGDIKAHEMVSKKSLEKFTNRKRKETPIGSFLREITACSEESSLKTNNTILSKYLLDGMQSWRDYLDIHTLFCKFRRGKRSNNADDFIEFCRLFMTEERCKQGEFATKDQSKSADWHRLRYKLIGNF